MNVKEENMIVSSLVFAYGDTNVLNGINMVLKKGEIALISGENGSGKTTLIDVLSGFIKFDNGEIIIDGLKKDKYTAEVAFNSGVSRTFQKPLVFYQLTIEDSLVVSAYSKNRPSLWVDLLRSNNNIKLLQQDIEYIKYIEQSFIIKEKEKEAGSLSYGQRKLLGFLQALLTRPKILLLDEPFAGVDKESEKIIIDLLMLYYRDNPDVSMIIISHEKDPVSELVESCYYLKNGKLEI